MAANVLHNGDAMPNRDMGPSALSKPWYSDQPPVASTRFIQAEPNASVYRLNFATRASRVDTALGRAGGLQGPCT